MCVWFTSIMEVKKPARVHVWWFLTNTGKLAAGLYSLQLSASARFGFFLSEICRHVKQHLQSRNASVSSWDKLAASHFIKPNLTMWCETDGQSGNICRCYWFLFSPVVVWMFGERWWADETGPRSVWSHCSSCNKPDATETPLHRIYSNNLSVLF